MGTAIAYLWILGFVTSAVLTIIGILRWLADSNKRADRMNIVSYCAFALFLFMLLSANWESVTSSFGSWLGNSAEATNALIDTSKITIKVMLMVLIVAFAVLLTLTAALFIIYGLWAMIRTIFSFGASDAGALKEELQHKAEKLSAMLNTPVFIAIIAGGILSVFGIIPIVMGTASDSLAECWKSGVEGIADFCTNGKDLTFEKSLSMYLLVYISVLGIGYAVANILYEIIKKTLGRKDGKSFLGEYSNSIGLLAVGVSILLMISSKDFDLNSDSSWLDLFVSFSKPFALILFIIALGVLALELVRLLMDMREKLIRKEARYLFVMLVGQCTVIIVKAFFLIYSALSSVLANGVQSKSTENHMRNLHEQIIEHVTKDLDEEIYENGKNTSGTKTPYTFFKKKVTKK